MIHLKKGYIGYAGGAILGALRSRYPQAYEALMSYRTCSFVLCGLTISLEKSSPSIWSSKP